MALDFPTSPTNGQVYEQYVYDSTLPGWRSKGGAVAAIYTSDTAPSGAVKGDMWYRTSDGTTYVYVVDINTSQWVEIRSEISTAKVGLVPIVPTSVSVSSGSASVAPSGKITLTGAGNVSINGIFSSAYKNYKIVFNYSYGTGAAWTSYKMRAAGVDASTAIYDSQYAYQGSYSLPSLARFTNETAGRWFPEGGYKTNWDMTMYGPYDALYTAAVTVGGYVNTDNSVEFGTTHSIHKTNTSYDGVSFFSSAGKVGTIQVFGIME